MALTVHADRNIALKEKYDSTVKQSNLVSGCIVYWKRPVLKPGENKKLLLPYEGPYIVAERFPEGTVAIKHLHTGKFVKHRVSVQQLKRVNYLRQLEGEPTPGAQEPQPVELGQVPAQMAPKMAYKPGQAKK
jgi:hypothetical protein